MIKLTNIDSAHRATVDIQKILVEISHLNSALKKLEDPSINNVTLPDGNTINKMTFPNDLLTMYITKTKENIAGKVSYAKDRNDWLTKHLSGLIDS